MAINLTIHFLHWPSLWSPCQTRVRARFKQCDGEHVAWLYLDANDIEILLQALHTFITTLQDTYHSQLEIVMQRAPCYTRTVQIARTPCLARPKWRSLQKMRYKIDYCVSPFPIEIQGLRVRGTKSFEVIVRLQSRLGNPTNERFIDGWAQKR